MLKRLDYGFNGYQLPSIPKAARSTRRRGSGSTKKKVEDKQMCAFDLLATIAGNLLQEGEVSQNTSLGKDQAVNIEDVVMEEQLYEVNPLKLEHCDHLSLELGIQAQVHQHDASLTLASVITSSDCLVKDDAPDSHSAKVEQCSENGHDSHGSEDVKFFDEKPPEPIGSDSSSKLSLGLEHHACGSVPLSRGDNVKVVTRDDDENSSGCTHPSTVKAITRWPQRIGGRKIRKLLASNYRRVAPKVKDGDLSGTEFRYIYRSRKTGYKRQRSQRIYPFKKRKIFHYNSLLNSDRNVGCKGVYSPDKGIDTSAASFGGHRANGSSSSFTGQSTTFSSRESHVKVRVKSFRVPELFIEMPETATIGSLKRTVMEALTALIGGGLHVGVHLQGKKIRDDNRTLLQSGIGRKDKVESLGFTLEPKSLHASPPLSSEDNSLVLSTHVPEPVSRCPVAIPIHHGTCHPSLDHPLINVGNLIESDHDSAPSPAEISVEKGTAVSRALVALPEETPQALAVVPAHHRSKRSEMAQRRIRRPFSVTEVEALVEAVEKLGTGRWRDVKLRAFDNMKHRTYVDLKDKWKTLVHTARISPQQRRGEPVPQVLLDRVLAAHSYWSQHQAKQQLKQQPETCLL